MQLELRFEIPQSFNFPRFWGNFFVFFLPGYVRFFSFLQVKTWQNIFPWFLSNFFSFFAAYNMVACRMTDARNGGNISQVPLKRSVRSTQDDTIQYSTHNDTMVEKVAWWGESSQSLWSLMRISHHHHSIGQKL